MSTSESLRARRVQVTVHELLVELEDGSRHRASITLFPILADATPEELSNWRLIADGVGIHWPDLDDIAKLLGAEAPELIADSTDAFALRFQLTDVAIARDSVRVRGAFSRCLRDATARLRYWEHPVELLIRRREGEWQPTRPQVMVTGDGFSCRV